MNIDSIRLYTVLRDEKLGKLSKEPFFKQLMAGLRLKLSLKREMRSAEQGRVWS